MYFKNKEGTWYGLLQSRKYGNMVVIWDAVLPYAGKGKIFLYNTEKDKVIEYVEAIVRPKLRELRKKELEEASCKYNYRWEQVKSAYVPAENKSIKGDAPNADCVHLDLIDSLANTDVDIDVDDDIELDNSLI